MSLKSRLRRLDAGVRWLETEGVLIRWQLMMKLVKITQEIADHTAGDPGYAERWNRKIPALPLPPPRVKPPPKPEAAPPVRPILRDAAVPAAPQDEVLVTARPHPEERRAAARLEGSEPAPLPGQPVAPPSPDMEIRPVRWGPRRAQDYDEEERPGTNGRCLTEYDVLRDAYDDDSLVE